ncbi:hypothetical protein P3X46_017493 [Hevea brasiliensis]|uniref:Glutaredoxin domain-containing protein n=1 Tax=Hevea brasiliensis TaxID=3981 RepID=A0ABQ9LMS8_HEVBR|nr:glutaredoxin-C5-like [Hevea brasiliensis]KAJ9169286.1 hypothetical protein P3X46_017493 [Hevea brasiliensis]
MQYQYQQVAESSSSWGYYVPPSEVRGMIMDGSDPLEWVARLAFESAVVIFSMSSCCMCHAVKRLFCGMGVNPTVYELDQDPRGKEIEGALMTLVGNYSSVVPVVFVGGKLVGAMDRVMASHINGTLVPLLKEAGALWL